MSQPAVVCRNKVQAELKAKIESLLQQTVFCRNIVEEECNHYCRYTINSVVTMIKENGKRTLSQQSFLYRNIKGLRLADELYSDKRPL